MPTALPAARPTAEDPVRVTFQLPFCCALTVGELVTLTAPDTGTASAPPFMARKSLFTGPSCACPV